MKGKSRKDNIRQAEKCFDRAVYEVGRKNKALAAFYFNAASGFLQKANEELKAYVS